MRDSWPLLVVVALLLAAASCERWKFRECRAVGHSTFYCLTKVGDQ